VSATKEDEIEALEGLKNANELITASIETDIKQLQSRCSELASDSEQANKHLLEALLAKNKLQEELQAEKASAEQVLAVVGPHVSSLHMQWLMKRSSIHKTNKIPSWISDSVSRSPKRAAAQKPKRYLLIAFSLTALSSLLMYTN